MYAPDAGFQEHLFWAPAVHLPPAGAAAAGAGLDAEAQAEGSAEVEPPAAKHYRASARCGGAHWRLLRRLWRGWVARLSEHRIRCCADGRSAAVLIASCSFDVTVFLQSLQS